MMRKVPLIVILGSTGTGKTKLSLELAERFGGEIISADSMQVYANLDIVTAKATKEEQSHIKHHLLDVASPSDPFTVVNFRNAALPIIENLLAQSKPPIVVGGTNYYIESLLWDILISPTTTHANSFVSNTQSTSMKHPSSNMNLYLSAEDMDAMPAESLHEHLKKIDILTANRLHPNNKRKIKRAIEVYQETGQTLSSKLKEQRDQPGGNRLGGPLRYPHTILFWLRCQQDVLNSRLDKRVDGMLEQGLLCEIRAFHNVFNSDNRSNCTENPYTRGVLQTIGYKEFIPYLKQFNAANDQKIENYLKLNAYKLPTEEHFRAIESNKSPVSEKTLLPSETNNVITSETTNENILPPGLELLQKCLSELKLVTQRYSKKQIKWINNRFLASKDRQVPDLYELDTTDVSAWQENVFERAVCVINAYRNGEICEIEAMPKRQHPGAGLNEETSNYCEHCQRYFIGEFQWQLHLKSNKHKKRVESIKKKLKLSEIVRSE